jgi:hypothetical protein
MSGKGDLAKAPAEVVNARDQAIAELAKGQGVDRQAELLLRFQSAIEVLEVLAEDDDEDEEE